MRFKLNLPAKESDTRIQKKFLLFPKRIDNECRWLEVASIKQMYICSKWEDIKFIN